MTDRLGPPVEWIDDLDPLILDVVFRRTVVGSHPELDTEPTGYLTTDLKAAYHCADLSASFRELCAGYWNLTKEDADG